MASAGRSLTRNPLIFLAGALLMLSGVAWAVGFVLILGSGAGVVEGLYLVFGLVVATLSIAAGWRVLHEDERGRSLGLILAIVGAVLTFLSLLGSTAVLIIYLVIDVFVIFVLVTRAREFA